ncbi:hypothetical protein [uncultured Clostridium sp.]|nr:hypothetical protein [uncultured Clostridium sp.]
MDFSNSPIDINSYVAKYMDEMGCSFEQACNDLGIEQSQVFSRNSYDEFY